MSTKDLRTPVEIVDVVLEAYALGRNYVRVIHSSYNTSIFFLRRKPLDQHIRSFRNQQFLLAPGITAIA